MSEAATTPVMPQRVHSSSGLRPKMKSPTHGTHSDGGVPTEAEHSHVAAAHVIRGEAGDVVAGDGHGDHFTEGKNHRKGQ